MRLWRSTLILLFISILELGFWYKHPRTININRGASVVGARFPSVRLVRVYGPWTYIADNSFNGDLWLDTNTSNSCHDIFITNDVIQRWHNGSEAPPIAKELGER